ncbi:MAG: hypothetical protein KZQ88_04385 [Candidatus Thiodiazotropha sp. (ex Dulcina madagascariensis)]|nr:hypothetical protein [Candidatus Thiodiazotropha sp. (ex Epidulcina cf. delphinae)]MCU7921914.1 hypothetical protein [Candidatus Thiodiazotropha sp. (ex Dulcina madagascariensis)]MCU7924855.1 hypothetical protein [Candidatus Thiodiazotropha sp. (ex Dulcina madagascariensis)]
MEIHRTIEDELVQIADHIRLLAILMLNLPGHQETEREELALVLQDLALRLERMAEVTRHYPDCSSCAEREDLL